MTLLQVCTEVTDPSVLEREVRALVEAAADHPAAQPVLVTLDTSPPASLPRGIKWQPAAEWLLG